MFKPGFIVKKLRLLGMLTTNHKLFTILDSLKAYLLKVNARINWKRKKNTFARQWSILLKRIYLMHYKNQSQMCSPHILKTSTSRVHPKYWKHLSLMCSLHVLKTSVSHVFMCELRVKNVERSVILKLESYKVLAVNVTQWYEHPSISWFVKKWEIAVKENLIISLHYHFHSLSLGR